MAGQPSKIGKYDIVRVIGRGGMGMVYQAVDPTIGRTVAIKSITAVLSDDPDLLKRFYREAQSTGKLQHPNIVTAYDLGEQDGVPYLVMEFLEGDSLDKIIRERRPCSIAEKLNIIIQACEGLGYAHHRQIIHRDVKPGNIVVLNDGGVKIVDFGIAQFGNERYTRTGQIVGSLYYMSPEQIQDADVDARSDIYSTGVVLFEFLTGALPFQGKDPTSTLAKILHEPPPSVANLVPLCPSEMDDVLRRALAKDRNNRYGSMEDFAFDLRSLQENLSRELITGFLRVATQYIEAQEWDKARDQLRQILNLDKQHRRANELLREVQTQIHKQSVTRQVRELRIRADEALSVRNWEEALKYLDQAVRIDGSDSELVEFRNSVRRSSTLLADALQRAEAARDAGDLEAAKHAVEEALSVDPSNSTAKALNAILSKELNERSKRRKVDNLVEGARKEISLRHFTNALQLLRDAEAIDSSAADVQQLIRSAAAGREHEQRRIALEKACSVIEDLLNRDEYVLACEKADEALKIFPQDLGLLKLKGYAEKQRDAWERHQFIKSQIATAQRLLDSEQLVEAQRVLNETLERYPDESGVISLLGIVTDSIARQEAQRREAERQATERRQFIRVHLETAAELQRTGKTSQAVKKVREALTRYSDSEELKSQLASLEAELAREETARQRAAEEARIRKAAVEKTISDSWQLLSNKKAADAVSLLERSLLLYPESLELKSQLEFVQRRIAVERAERERAEQEAKQRRAEIQRQVASGQRLLESKQTNEAVSTLERALQRFPESDDLKSLLQAARQQYASEQAERERAQREAQQRQAEIDAVIGSARRLLEAGQTKASTELIQQAMGRYPGNAELKAALDFTQQRLAAEEAARSRAEEEQRRRRSWIDAEITCTQQWIDNKQAERAVTSLHNALNQYPESPELKAQLELAMYRLQAEQAEREKAAREAKRRQQDINQSLEVAQSHIHQKKLDLAVRVLEDALQKFPDSEELRSQLGAVKQHQLEEENEKRRLEEEKHRRQNEIERELSSAQKLLGAKRTQEAITALEAALRKYPDSPELSSQLKSARDLIAREAEERRRAAEEEARKRQVAEQERRKAEVTRILFSATQLLDSSQTERAVQELSQAVASFPESEELKARLNSARKVLEIRRAEQKLLEEEAQRRRAAIETELAAARTLLDSKRTKEAVARLVSASEKYKASPELQTLLDAARKQLAREEEERRQAEEQARRRQEEIANQLASARRLLQSNELAKAADLLEQSTRQYSESEPLRSLLAEARERLAAERAEQERLAREAEARRKRIAAELDSANSLLKSRKTADAIRSLEDALRTYPESKELRSLLASGQEQLERERLEREKIEKRQAQLQAEITRIRSLLTGGAPEEALQAAEQALSTYGKAPELQQLISSAHEGVKQKKAEEKKRAAERQREEERKRQRDRDLADLRKLAASAAAATKPATVQKSLRKAQDIAARYSQDAEFQRTLAEVKEAIDSARAKPQKPEATETRFATRLFTPGEAQSEPTSVPVPSPTRQVQDSSLTPLLPKLLNKWTAVSILALVALGVGVRYLLPSHKEPVPTTAVHTPAQPSLEDQQRQGIDEADKLVASGNLDDALQALQRAAALNGPLTPEIRTKESSIEAARNDAGLRKLRQQEETLWQSAKADLDAGHLQAAQTSLKKILALPEGGARKEEARNYLDQVLPRRQQEETLFANAKQAASSKDVPTLSAAQKSLDSIIQMNGPRKAEAEDLRQTVTSKIADANKAQRDQSDAQLLNAARQDISRGDFASARQKADQIKSSGGNADTLLADIDRAQTEKAKSTQYENSFQAAVQQYQQAAASNDKNGLERARNNFQAIAQQDGVHARDAQTYLHDIEGKIVALNQPPMYSASQPASPSGKPGQPLKISVDDSAVIRDVIKHYEQAFADRNADELRQIWPDIGDKYAAYKKSFGLASAQNLEVTIESVKISDNADQATVTASTITNYTPKGGKTITRPDHALFDLLRKNGTWIIKDVR